MVVVWQLSCALHRGARTLVSRPRPRSRCGRARRKYSSRQIGAPRSLHFNLILQTELDRFAIAGNDSQHFNNSKWTGEWECGEVYVDWRGGVVSKFQVLIAPFRICFLLPIFLALRSDQIKHKLLWWHYDIYFSRSDIEHRISKDMLTLLNTLNYETNWGYVKFN